MVKVPAVEPRGFSSRGLNLGTYLHPLAGIVHWFVIHL